MAAPPGRALPGTGQSHTFRTQGPGLPQASTPSMVVGPQPSDSNLDAVEARYHQDLVEYFFRFAIQGLLPPAQDERQARARHEAIQRAALFQQQQASAHQNQAHFATTTSPAVDSTSASPYNPSPNPPPRVWDQSPPDGRSARYSTPVDAPRSWADIGASLARSNGGAATQSDVGIAPRPASFAGLPTSGSRSEIGLMGPTTAKRKPLPVPPGRAATLPFAIPPVPESPRTSVPPEIPPRNGHKSPSPAAVASTPSPRPPLPVPPKSRPASFPASVPSKELPEVLLARKMANLGMSPPPEPPSSKTAPKAPSFSFSAPDELDVASPPAVPSFSFSETSDTPSPPPSPPKRRLHPRSDPSHPSHPLYHPLPSSSSSAQIKLEAGMVTCMGCERTMFGRALVACGGQWHPDCFVCAADDCEERLEHIQFEEKAGKVWCMVHYEEQFGMTCFHCHTPIADESFLTISDARLQPIEPATRTYHSLHFFCASCGDPFVDPKSLGKNREDTIASPYMVHKGYAYCEKCDLRLYREKCRGCKKGVGDEWVEPGGEDDGKWHPECFICVRCKKPLDDRYLTEEEDEGGQVYCIPCYHVKAAEEAQKVGARQKKR